MACHGHGWNRNSPASTAECCDDRSPGRGWVMMVGRLLIGSLLLFAAYMTFVK